MKCICVFLIAVLFPFQVMADIKVIDGDSLEIDGLRIRIQGIDSPEYGQFCYKEDKTEYNCGNEATKFLQVLVDSGEVVCVEESIDRYGRSLSTCYVDDYESGVIYNMNVLMIKSGWAVVYRSDNEEYKAAEKYARDNKLGVWQGKFMKPELYRALHR